MGDRPPYQQLFIALRVPAQHLDPRRRQPEVLRDETDDGLVGLAVCRWCRRTYSQRAIDDADNRVVFGARNDANCNNEVIASRLRAVAQQFGQKGNNLNPVMMIRNAVSRIMANSGDRSSPPRGGMTRLNGRKTGSVSVLIMATAGL